MAKGYLERFESLVQVASGLSSLYVPRLVEFNLVIVKIGTQPQQQGGNNGDHQ